MFPRKSTLAPVTGFDVAASWTYTLMLRMSSDTLCTVPVKA